MEIAVINEKKVLKFLKTESLPHNLKDMLSHLWCCKNLKLFNVSEKLVSFTTYISQQIQEPPCFYIYIFTN